MGFFSRMLRAPGRHIVYQLASSRPRLREKLVRLFQENERKNAIFVNEIMQLQGKETKPIKILSERRALDRAANLGGQLSLLSGVAAGAAGIRSLLKWMARERQEVEEMEKALKERVESRGDRFFIKD